MVGFVNIDKNPEISEGLRIPRAPLFLFYAQGEEVSRVGASPSVFESSLREALGALSGSLAKYVSAPAHSGLPVVAGEDVSSMENVLRSDAAAASVAATLAASAGLVQDEEKPVEVPRASPSPSVSNADARVPATSSSGPAARGNFNPTSADAEDEAECWWIIK